jgi:hypothetical protein
LNEVEIVAKFEKACVDCFPKLRAPKAQIDGMESLSSDCSSPA